MLFKFKTIGSRLVAAFTCVLLMVGLVSSVAFITWKRLDYRVDLMLDDNVPALKASYELERNSAELQACLNEIYTTGNLTRLNQLKARMATEMSELNQATVRLTELPLVNNLRQEYALLNADIQLVTRLLERRIELSQALDKTSETILWLHQDIIDELTPLNQELEWQITNSQTSSLSPKKLALLSNDFSTLQQLTFNENELVSLVQEVIRQHQQRNLDSAFQFIGYKTQETSSLSDALQHNAASITQHQLLLELITLVQPNGKLHQLLQEIIANNEQTEQQKAIIKSRLSFQQHQITQLVIHTSQALAGIKHDAKTAVKTGNQLLFAVLISALLCSAFICTYFVRKRIVARLHDLSLALNAVVTGEVELPVSVNGRDEIGKLGNDLRNFCLQRQEIEKTNALNLINNTQASIITCTTQGIIESMNVQAKELFPLLTASFIKSEAIWDLFEPQKHQQLKSIFTQNSTLLREGAFCLTVAMHDTQHQIRYFRLDLRLFQQNSVPKVIITLTDITEQENIARWLEQKVEEKTQNLSAANSALQDEIEERKRAEADLVTTQDELIQAAKMAVVGQAMTTLAHELNQPLSALSTYIYTVQMSYDETTYPELNDTMDKMDEVCERMDHIIANLRSFSKKTSTAKPVDRVNMFDATRHAIDIVSCRAKQHNIQLINLIPTNSHALGETIQIEQVLVNLLLNSCDALAPLIHIQGRVDIIEISRTDKRLTLACCDNGQGFDNEIIAKLFTPFTTTKEVGLGLGLSICRSIMRRMNGAIRLASTPAGGAMIILEFPTHDAQ
ncbi:ATP-binding protein [Photobacterium kasasachensis]|uniref:ATP-binding protein n=1 Tax=Photobacterium kasasachensis TaxID=2910240 RepID=UPI003D104724